MKKTLVAVTTHNQSSFTKKCLKTLLNQSVDVAVFDDCSSDNTRDVCKKYNVPIFVNKKRRGVTYSWNKAYQYFLKNDYDILIISNNDVLVPQGAIDNIVRDLETHFYVGALTRLDDGNFEKSSKWYGRQAVESFYPVPSSFANNPKNFQAIQDQIQAEYKAPVLIEVVYGFFFGVTREIKKYEFFPNILFNPWNKYLHQEQELSTRTKGGYLCLNAFVYHFQGVSKKLSRLGMGRKRSIVERVVVKCLKIFYKFRQMNR